MNEHPWAKPLVSVLIALVCSGLAYFAQSSLDNAALKARVEDHIKLEMHRGAREIQIKQVEVSSDLRRVSDKLDSVEQKANMNRTDIESLKRRDEPRRRRRSR